MTIDWFDRLVYLGAISLGVAMVPFCTVEAQPRVGTDPRIPITAIKTEDGLGPHAAAVALVVSTFPSSPTSSVLDTSETGSGVLIAPCLVLTARHVLGLQSLDSTTGRSISVTLFRRVSGNRVEQVHQAATVRAAGGGIGRWTNSSVTDDWAILELDGLVEGIAPIELAPGDCCNPFTTGRAALVGFPADQYNAGRPIPWVDPDCRVTERLANRMLATNCIATSGNSGGPLLIETGNGWRMAGLLTRAAPLDMSGSATRADNFAIPIGQGLRKQIQQAQLASRCPPSAPAPTINRIMPANQIGVPDPPPTAQPPRKRPTVPWFRPPWRAQSPPPFELQGEQPGPVIPQNRTDVKPPKKGVP